MHPLSCYCKLHITQPCNLQLKYIPYSVYTCLFLCWHQFWASAVLSPIGIRPFMVCLLSYPLSVFFCYTERAKLFYSSLLRLCPVSAQHPSSSSLRLLHLSALNVGEQDSIHSNTWLLHQQWTCFSWYQFASQLSFHICIKLEMYWILCDWILEPIPSFR